MNNLDLELHVCLSEFFEFLKFECTFMGDFDMGDFDMRDAQQIFYHRNSFE
jgi:hypothetical protein